MAGPDDSIWLVERPEGSLTTEPSTSPEHKFHTPEGGLCGVSSGSTIDMSLSRELLSNTSSAARLLGVDSALAGRCDKASKKLLPFTIGNHGRLQEWSEDFEDEHHRHVSPTYGLYPGNQIAPDSEIGRAARTFLEIRGDEGTGWSLASSASCPPCLQHGAAGKSAGFAPGVASKSTSGGRMARFSRRKSVLSRERLARSQIRRVMRSLMAKDEKSRKNQGDSRHTPASVIASRSANSSRRLK
jgi:hypothetical protein